MAVSAEVFAGRLKEALVRAVIWGFVGVLFGSLFLIAMEILRFRGLETGVAVAAGMIAGAISALIYGSMRLAVIVAAVCSVVSVVLLMRSAAGLTPSFVLLVAAGFGAVIGALYGWLARTSRVFRADAKALAGAFAGLLVSAVYYGLTSAADLRPPIALSAGVLCPLVGGVYVWVAPVFIRWFANLLPPAGDGAVVGAGVAAYVGLGMWLVAGYISPEITGAFGGLNEEIMRQLPGVALAGLTGGALAGFTGGMLGRGWQDL